MRIAVSAAGTDLNAPVDPRFGRCPYFVIVETETMDYEAIPNTAQGAMSGAGIQAAQTVISRGAKAVLTGNVGPNAYQVFSATGVQVITGVFGTVREAVERFKRGELKAAPTPAQPLYGGPGFGMGYGMGMRRGGGMGRGRWWSGMWGPQVPPPAQPVPSAPAPSPLTREQEIEMLSNYLKTLEEQMKQIRKRLEELRK